jgi:hypothetical protein
VRDSVIMKENVVKIRRGNLSARALAVLLENVALKSLTLLILLEEWPQSYLS